METKLTHRYAFIMFKMKKTEGRNEYMDLAKEANLLWQKCLERNLRISLLLIVEPS